MADQELVYVVRARDEASANIRKVSEMFKGNAKQIEYWTKNQERLNKALEMFDRHTKKAEDNVSRLRKEHEDTAKAADEMTEATEDANDALSDQEKAIAKVGKELGGYLASIAGIYALQKAFGSLLGAYSDLEASTGALSKNTNLSSGALDGMRSHLQGLIQDLPVTSDRMWELSEVSTEVGVKGEQGLRKLTEALARAEATMHGVDAEELLAVVRQTDLAAEEASNPGGGLTKFANALNFMADNSATSAPELMTMAENITNATAAFDIGWDHILAWSTVLSEANVKAVSASSAFTQLTQEITTAVREGGPQLSNFATLTGMTVTEFEKLAKVDMAGAINTVVESLGNIQKNFGGQGAFTALDAIGISDAQSARGIISLAKNYDKLGAAMAGVSDEAAHAERAQREIDEQMDQFNIKLQKMGDAWTTLKGTVGATFGEALVPLIDVITDLIQSFTEWYNTLSEGEQRFVAFSTAAIGSLALLAPSIIKVIGLMKLLGGSMAGVAGLAGALAGPFAIVAAGLGTMVFALKELNDYFDTGSNKMEQYATKSDEASQALYRLYEDAKDTVDAQADLASAADTASDRMASEKTVVDALSVSMRRLGIEAQFTTLMMARATQSAARNRLAQAQRKYEEAKAAPRGLGDRGIPELVETKRRQDLIAATKDMLIQNELLTNATSEFTSARAAANQLPEASGSGGGGNTLDFQDLDSSSSSTGGGRKTDAEKAAEKRAEYFEQITRDIAHADALLKVFNNTELKGLATLEDEVAFQEARLALMDAMKVTSLELSDQEAQSIRDRINKERELAAVEQQRMDAAQARLDKQADDQYYYGMMAIGFADTAENAKRVALLEAEADATRNNITLSAERKIQIAQQAEAMWNLNRAQQEYNEQMDFYMGIAGSISGSFADLITGARGFKSALGSLAGSLADLIVQYTIVLPMMRAFQNSLNGVGGPAQGLFGSLGSMFSVLFAKGGAFEDGVQMFAKGDVVNRPTLFRMSRGVGMMGEAGPEAILPLSRGPDGKLGVNVNSDRGSKVGGSLTFAPSIAVTVENRDSDMDPGEMGRVIGEAIDQKIRQFAHMESRPGGMLWR